MDKRAMTAGLLKAIEVYEELGFKYLPLKQDRITDLLKSRPVYAVSESQEIIVKEPEYCFSVDKDRALQQLREDIGDCTRC